MTKFNLQRPPRIGEVLKIDGVSYRVWDIPCYGTIILESMDRKQYFRLCGQAWEVQQES